VIRAIELYVELQNGKNRALYMSGLASSQIRAIAEFDVYANVNIL
jgi:hypothetical protein